MGTPAPKSTPAVAGNLRIDAIRGERDPKSASAASGPRLDNCARDVYTANPVDIRNLAGLERIFQEFDPT